MIKNYELYFIFNPVVDAAKRSTEMKKIEKMLKSDLKAENIRAEDEGLKNLAYPIKKNKSGFYVSVKFDADTDNIPNISKVEAKLNIQDSIIRYILMDQTKYLKQKAKESLNEGSEVSDHREYNKGKGEKKDCLSKHLGMKVIDFKDVEYISQFVSPYSKIFGRDRTGNSAKFQRKITKAIKQARHMALMSFTPNHEE